MHGWYSSGGGAVIGYGIVSVAWLSPVGDYELLADDISNFKLDTLTQTQQKYS